MISREVKGQSLHATYLVMAFVVSMVLVIGSALAAYYIKKLNRESAQSIQTGNAVAEVIGNIRNHVWKVESSLNTIFISQTMADKQALIGHLDQAIDALESLKILNEKRAESIGLVCDSLRASLVQSKSNILILAEKSEDLNWVYPILPYINDTLLQSNQAFNDAITVILDEVESEGASMQTNQMFRAVTELRDMWRRQILDFRATVIRLVALNQKANHAQAANLDLRHQVILETIDSIEDLYNQDPFGLDTEGAISALRLRAEKWFSGFKQFGKVLNNNIWRSDIHYIKTEILPVQKKVAQYLGSMEQMVRGWSTENVNKVKSAARVVYLELWTFAILSLLLVGIGYNILSRTLLKPIARLSEDLNNDIHITDSKPLTTHGKGMLFNSKEVVSLIASYNDMKEIIKARDNELKQINQSLEEQVKIRTDELETSVNELKTFNYSVSHDLRAPLRSIDGFSKALQEDYEDELDDTARDYLERIRKSTHRMGDLIDDMLKLSAISRMDLTSERVNLTAMVNNIIDVLSAHQTNRQTEITVEDNVTGIGDRQLLQIALENLLGNAWKYSHKKPKTIIKFGMMEQDGRDVYYISDQGAGFNMDYANKLFGVFQRLHGNEYEGTGIGLATVKRIIERHGGEIWAESVEHEGSTFYFTLAAK